MISNPVFKNHRLAESNFPGEGTALGSEESSTLILAPSVEKILVHVFKYYDEPPIPWPSQFSTPIATPKASTNQES